MVGERCWWKDVGKGWVCAKKLGLHTVWSEIRSEQYKYAKTNHGLYTDDQEKIKLG